MSEIHSLQSRQNHDVCDSCTRRFLFWTDFPAEWYWDGLVSHPENDQSHPEPAGMKLRRASDELTWQTSLSALKESVKAPCKICETAFRRLCNVCVWETEENSKINPLSTSFFDDSVIDFSMGHDFDSGKFILDVKPILVPSGLARATDLVIWLPVSSDTGSISLKSIRLSLWLTWIAQGNAARYLKCSPSNLDVPNAQAFKFARACLERCKKTCDDCLVVPKDGRYHWRLVQLLANDEENDLRLVYLEGSVEQFGALSYCWGDSFQSQATFKSNVHTRTEFGFQSRHQPATIRDAIKVLKTLGFHYMWIDSLCIVQDSKADIDRETRHIKSIFEQSSVTIVAASSADVKDGFLFDRNTKSGRRMIRVPWFSKDKLETVLVDSGYRDPLDDDPIHRRAWTLEEWLLSRRRLLYTGNQLVWKCHGFETCDGGHESLSIPAIAELEELDEDSDDENIFEVDGWHRLVCDYMRRGLSEPKDKLLAIDGLAQKWAERERLTYVYGLWKEHFLSGLCWRRTRWNSVSARSENCGFPTWSWASVDFDIAYDKPARIIYNTVRLQNQSHCAGILSTNPDENASYAWFHNVPSTESIQKWNYKDLFDFNVKALQQFETVEKGRVLEFHADDRSVCIRAHILEVESLEIPQLKDCLRWSSLTDFLPEWAPLCDVRLVNETITKPYSAVIWPDTLEVWSVERKRMRCVFLDAMDMVTGNKYRYYYNTDSCGILVIPDEVVTSSYRRIGWLRCVKQDLGRVPMGEIRLV